jgi:two-component system sensor histidine kinase/response regulator
MNNSSLENKGDILIVDDIPENLQILFTMLSEQGYDVRRVLSGKQGLKAAKYDPPDLILLDIKMPEMDGYEVCKKLKESEETKDIPIIFLSALNDTFDKVRAFEVGGSDYITKPFQLPEVLIRVKNQLELFNAKNQLQEKNNQLQSLNKELESFSYSVAHDLNNPLTNILGFTDILKDKYKNVLDEKGLHFIDIMHQSGLQMRDIIENLLRLSQVKYLEMELKEVNLSKLIESSFENLQKNQKNQKNRLFALNMTSDIMGKGDINLLRLAIENICSNAWKYTQYKDIAQIEFGVINPAQQNQNLLEKSNNLPVYFLKDNGIGFAMEEANKLFIPFNRLHNKHEFEGTGIGLSIVYRIIDRHNGNIWCEANTNEGATFYFTLNAI